MSRRKRFGEILLDAGVITPEGLDKALKQQSVTRKRLGKILEELGEITERDIAVALARQFGLKTVSNLISYPFPEDVLKLVSGAQALEKMIFPLRVQQKSLWLAMVNPLDMETVDSVSFRTGLSIVPYVTTPSEIQSAAEKYYGQQSSAPACDWWLVLVVDDQEQARGITCAALRREGYSLLEAADGAEGLRIAIQSQPHLVIADTVMPRMDGHEMFRAMKANSSTAHIPVIALSAKATPEDEARALDLDYLDFIPKPINPIRLSARVRHALRAVYGDSVPPSRK